MTEDINQAYPPAYLDILEATKRSGFNMASDILTCSLLRTLAASKPAGTFLELGTGTGLSAAWFTNRHRRRNLDRSRMEAGLC